MAEQTRTSDRAFTQDEAEQILQRAAKLGAQGSGRAELLASDLRKIAAEAGIDPVAIDRAIAELDARPSVSERIFLGAPLSVQLERTVEVDLPATEFERFLPEIQRVLGDVGHASMLGNTLTWTSADPKGAAPTQIIISRSGRKLLIRASARMSSTAGGLLGGIGGGVGGGLGGPIGAAVAQWTQSVPITVAAVLGIVGGALLLARTIYSSVVHSKERKLTQLLDRLAEVARAS